MERSKRPETRQARSPHEKGRFVKRRNRRFAIVLTATLALLAFTGMGTAHAAASFTQGFETDTAGWFPVNPPADAVTRVASGSPSVSYNAGTTSAYANGVLSATGGSNARLTSAVSSGSCTLDSSAGGGPALQCYGPYTDWGLGFANAQAFPSGGYTTQLDIYLDDVYAAAHPDCGQQAPCTPNTPGTINPACQTNPSGDLCEGSRFDWLTAYDNPSGGFIGQYAFNVGTGPNNSANFPCSQGWVIAASTNVKRSGANPYNLGNDPKCLAGSDWYTFRASFRDDSGSLAVDMDVLKPNGDVASCTNQSGSAVPCSWTQAGPPIGGVGCTEYGWFANQEINDLPIDNTLMDGCGKTSPTIATTLSASGGINGDTFHDSATLTGATSDAGGTVNYRYYASPADCTSDTTGTAGHDVSTETVTNGNVPPSDDETFTTAGTFYWAAFYSGDVKNNPAKSDCASEPLEIATQVAKITPTGTTCLQYQNGTAATLARVFYSVKGGNISAVNPGVFFYYTRVTGAAGDTVAITQSHTGTAPTIPIQQKQVLLYSDPGCATLKWRSLTVTSGTATGTLPSTGSFIISVKYDTSSLKGKPAPDSSPTTYTFGTNHGGPILADIARVDLVRK
jgi:hypothetical protein